MEILKKQNYFFSIENIILKQPKSKKINIKKLKKIKYYQI